MNPRVKKVFPLADYKLHLVFKNDEEKVYDVEPFINEGVFAKLKEGSNFNTVEPFQGSLSWQGGQDICPDMLYEDSIPL